MLRQRRSFSSHFLTRAVLVLVFLLLAWPWMAGILRRGADSIFVPISLRLHGSPVDNSASDEVIRQRARIQELEEENAALRRTASVSGDASYERVFSRVLWRDPDPSRQSGRILLPDNSGAAIGDPVVAPGDVLVGRVVRIYSRTADVLFVNDPEFEVSVRLGEEVGSGRGNGGSGVAIQFIPVNAVLPQDGVAVRSAGLGEGIPQGLLVGWLSIGKTSPESPFANIAAISPEEFQGLRFVEILLTH